MHVSNLIILRYLLRFQVSDSNNSDIFEEHVAKPVSLMIWLNYTKFKIFIGVAYARIEYISLRCQRRSS
jgi:hypothetical protein